MSLPTHAISPGARIAVTGATGYIGTRLVPRLASAGYSVRCLVRSPRKLRDREWHDHPAIEIVKTDLESATLADQLTGCEAAYFLVHSMQSGAHYAETDRGLAQTFADACAAAGVKRIIYLGGLGKAGPGLSEHLGSRLEVERILGSGPVPVTAFRAAMIIGSGSASFEILRYLAERLPIMVTPRWVATESQPIAIRNVLNYLITALSVGETAGRTLEIGGADVVTYKQLLQAVAAERGLSKRIIIPVPVLTPFLSSLWIHLVTPASARMARPLAEGLRNRVVVDDHTAELLMPQQLLTSREAIRMALDAEARSDIESSWSAAGPMRGDPDWTGGDVFEDARRGFINATPERVFEVITQLGGRQGWFRYNSLWRLRGWLDRLVGGPGSVRGRRHPKRLAWGETLDFWRVVEIEPARRLTLRAEMRTPGDAVLDFELAPATSADGVAGTAIVQTARYRPRGLAGLAYWYLVLPFHKPVFDGLLDGISRAATRTGEPAQEVQTVTTVDPAGE